MVSPLEDYFNNQDFSPNSSQGEYTAAEKLFMQKYLGVSEDDLPGKSTKPGLVKTQAAELAPVPDAAIDYIKSTSFEPDTSMEESASPAFIEKAVETDLTEEMSQTAAEETAEAAEEKPIEQTESEGPHASADEADAPAEAEVQAQPEPEAAQPVIAAEPEAAPAAEPKSAAEPEPAASPAVQEKPAAAPVEMAQEKAPQAKETSAAREEYEEEKKKEPPLEEILKQEERCQMVAFFIGDQEFVVPTMAIQEVIRFEEPIKIPMAPEFVEGVITLRGRVTPVVNLRDMLAVTNKPRNDNKCIIICNRRGIQLGFVVEKIHTMYWAPQKDMEWAVEAQLGINAEVDFISAVMKSEDGEMLMGMLSVDKIIDYILR